MRPAFSVIVFTSLSGAGYGLLALLGVWAAWGTAPADRGFGLVALGLALGLITAGLLSSTAHLGRPERAWRAFSQWRSSWLSREAVASVAAYVPAVAFAIGWVVVGRTDGWVALAGALAAAGAAVTVAATGMIYASLTPIAQWHNRFTLPAYLLLATMTGAVLLGALLHLFGGATPLTGALAVLVTAVAWAWKAAAWRHNDRLMPPATLNSATGLAGGTVRSIEWPHTEENYVLEEMGYRVARKHRVKLRRLVHLLAFALPLGLGLVALVVGGGASATVAAVGAALLQMPGVLIERWLFFAEAKHTVALYYGR